ncbi:MAG: hypothetical protein GY854_08810 [Deltaproteobacteria bacterium]|nr:hypothetical protein [Deltaproteobacteria bacterium]
MPCIAALLLVSGCYKSSGSKEDESDASGLDTDTNTGVGADADSDSDTDADSDVDTDSDSDSDTDIDADTDTDSDVDTDTDTDTNIDTDTDNDETTTDEEIVHDYEGWVVGWSGNSDNQQGIVWHDDHGTWMREELPIVPRRLNDVCFLTADNGWAVGSIEEDSSEKGLILHRNETEWERVNLPNVQCIEFSRVEFIDADNGWALCSQAENNIFAYRFTQGDWEAVGGLAYGPYFVREKGDIAPLASNHVFVSGILDSFFEYLDGQIAMLLWKDSFDWFEGMQIVGSDDGYLARCMWRADYYSLVFYRLGDEKTWTLVEEEIPFSGCVGDFARSKDGTWYAAVFGSNAPVLKQSPGEAWQSMETPPLLYQSRWSGLFDVDFPADDFAVGVGEDSESHGTDADVHGYVIRYDGEKWTRINRLSGEYEFYQGVSYVSSL